MHEREIFDILLVPVQIEFVEIIQIPSVQGYQVAQTDADQIANRAETT